MGVAYHCSLCFIANGRVSNCLPFCKYRLQSNFKKWQAVNQRRRKVVKVALNNARREPPQMSSPCLTNPKLQNSKKLLHLLMLIAMVLFAVKICKIFILHWDAISKIPKKDEMLAEGAGPINFQVFLGMFGDKISGTDPEDTIKQAFHVLAGDDKGVIPQDLI